MQYQIERIHEMIGGEVVIAVPDYPIEYLATDSRKISFAKSALFFALSTSNRNGIEFLPEVYQQGVRNFVISAAVDFAEYPEANFLIVKDTLAALQSLAIRHRSQFSYPVIGITGSNGKTIVKEWLNFLLSGTFKIIRSPRSFNSQIGVPLSVWGMEKEHNLGIFEAGISRVGEMARLQSVIDPTIGILTNIGDAHQQGFSSEQEKLAEKLQLFADTDILFYPARDNWVQAFVEQHFTDPETKQITKKLIGIGRSAKASYRVLYIEKHMDRLQTEIAVQVREGKPSTLLIPYTDEASIQNAITCWAVCLHLGLTTTSLEQGLKELPVIDMRLQVVPAIHQGTVINDSYSLDAESLKVALDLLNQQLLSKTLILSDIPELAAAETNKSYSDMAALINNKKIHRLITIGPQWQKYKAFVQVPKLEQYGSTTAFVKQFQPGKFKEEAILLKGARAFQFEEILGLLMDKVHQTKLEINLSAIVHNLKVYRSCIEPSTKLMAMVKAFAYGSGIVEIASVLQYHKIDYLAVAYADEGVALRQAGIHLPIMVMNADEYSFEPLVQHQLEPEIYSFDILDKFIQFLQKQGLSQYPVHIKLDTGMHRLGFETSDIPSLIRKIQPQQALYIKSAFSHFTSSEDDQDDAFTLGQVTAFKAGCQELRVGIGYHFLCHIANSAAIARFPEFQMDMVRLGIGLYGINTTGETLPLRIVASLKTTIAQIKKLEPGTTVGYNRKGKINKPTTIATIRIGYADGFSRLLGNGTGKVLIHGQEAAVIGNVCMDMTMVDITHIPEARTGDPVEIFGENIPVQQMAASSHTSSYEIFTSVGQRIPRIYVED